MFTIDLQMLNLAIGLLGLILVNILLGSVSAILEKKFDKTKFFNGIIKGVIVAFCFIAVYFIGLLTPSIIIMEMNGQEVTLLTAIQLILLTSFLYYGKEVVVKLAFFVNAKFGDRGSGEEPPNTTV